MYPKPLKDLCIDQLVDATVTHQIYNHHYKKLFDSVRELWQELFGLSQVHERAVSLLHAQVMRTHQLGIPLITHRMFTVQIVNIFPPIVTLLAARATRICFDPGMVQLSREPLYWLEESGIFTEPNHLQRIDASSIDLGFETQFLVHLLPRCQKLTVLMLDCNVTASILYAAKQCPLKVLHVSEHILYNPQLFLKVLAELVLGIQGTDLNTVLESYVKGTEVAFNPAWPDLTNFSTGKCTVSREFLILVLVVLRKMEYLESDVVAISDVVMMYATMLQKIPSLHKLELKANTIMYEDFWQVYPYYPKLERVSLTIAFAVMESLTKFFELGHLLPNVRMLRLTHVPSRTPFFLPEGKFLEFRSRLTVLELDVIELGELEARWILSLIRQFPSLKRLNLISNLIVYTEPIDQWMKVFDTVIDIQCVCDNHNDLFLRFLFAFPNVHTLTLTAYEGEISLPWERLRELRKLRNLNLFACAVSNISGLCKMPHSTPENLPWELCVAPRHVSVRLVSRLKRAGWTWVPINDVQHTLCDHAS